ncbi:MAG: hypothetical protein RIG61_00115 [Deltaproteobacteria bacterium]
MVGKNGVTNGSSGKEGNKPDKGKKRSPNYPCIDLEKALELTEKIYSADKRAPIPVETLISRWGLPKYNSYVRQLIAALSYYGLINSSGKGENRRISVSDRAYRILENAGNRESLIKEAALEPKIFGEVWQHYRSRGLPSNEVLERDLVWQQSFANIRFTKNGAKAFIRNLKSTINFAEIEPDEVVYRKENGSSIMDTLMNVNSLMNAAGFRRVDLTLGSGAVATVQIPSSITEKEIEYLQDGIRLIKGDLFPEMNSKNSQS